MSTSVPCHTSFTSSTSRCWRYRVYIVSTSVPCHRWLVIPRLHRSHHQHCDVDNIVSISCRHLWPVIPRLHRLHCRHCDVDDIVSTSCQHRYHFIVCLSYLVYIVDIAMSTILCRYRVDIRSISYLVYIVDIAMLTISCRYRVDIGTLLYLVYIVNIVDIVMSTISCLYRSTSLPSHISFTSFTSRNQKYTIALFN